MLSPEQLMAFLAAAVLVTASPGPDNLMVLGVVTALVGAPVFALILIGRRNAR